MIYQKDRGLFWLFFLLAAFIVVVCTVLIGGYLTTAFASPLQALVQLGKARSPYMTMALVNLLLLLLVCVCGALLYSKTMAHHPKGYWVIALVSATAAFFLHAMVYGLVLFIPVPYSLLGANHITLAIFDGLSITPFSMNPLLCVAVGILIHLFAPQVLLSVIVCILAIRKYRKAKKAVISA